MPKITYRDAIRDAMSEEMRADANVFLMGEEVAEYNGAYKCSQGMWEEFGNKRVIDTPIAELGFSGIAIGSAMAGLRPIVEFMTWNFSMMAIDQVINSAAKTHYMSGGKVNCPIVFRGPNGVAAGTAAQHSQDFSSWYMSVPGLKVVAPATPADAKGLIKSAIRDNSPVIVLENELIYGMEGEVPAGEHLLEIGKASVMRKGSDVSIIAHSINSLKAMEAAEKLVKEGINAEVLDLRTLRPLDVNAIVKTVSKTHKVVVVTETWETCGVASEIMRVITDNCWDELDAPVAHVSAVDVPMPYAKNLESLVVPQVSGIVSKVKSIL